MLSYTVYPKNPSPAILLIYQSFCQSLSDSLPFRFTHRIPLKFSHDKNFTSCVSLQSRSCQMLACIANRRLQCTYRGIHHRLAARQAAVKAWWLATASTIAAPGVAHNNGVPRTSTTAVLCRSTQRFATVTGFLRDLLTAQCPRHQKTHVWGYKWMNRVILVCFVRSLAM